MYHIQIPKEEGCGYLLFSVHRLVGGDDFDCQGDVRTRDEEYFVERKKKVFRRKWQCRGLVSLTCVGESSRETVENLTDRLDNFCHLCPPKKSRIHF